VRVWIVRGAAGVAGLGVAGALVVTAVPGVSARISCWYRHHSAIPGGVAWSADGRTLVFSRYGRCTSELAQVGATGGRVRRVVGTLGGDQAPALSARGAILTLSWTGLWRIDGSRRTKIGPSASDFGGSWSPDSRRVAYTHGSVGGLAGDHETSLYVVAADGARVRRILHHGIEPGAPAWSPGGDLLAVAGIGGVYTLHPDGTKLTRVFRRDDTTFDVTPPTLAWSRDGRFLAWLDDGVEILDVRRRKIVRSFGSGGSNHDSAAWSPDGEELAYTISLGGRTGLFVIDLRTGRTRRLAGT
jgi:Tol biopolymer transport system component